MFKDSEVGQSGNSRRDITNLGGPVFGTAFPEFFKAVDNLLFNIFHRRASQFRR